MTNRTELEASLYWHVFNVQSSRSQNLYCTVSIPPTAVVSKTKTPKAKTEDQKRRPTKKRSPTRKKTYNLEVNSSVIEELLLSRCKGLITRGGPARLAEILARLRNTPKIKCGIRLHGKISARLRLVFNCDGVGVGVGVVIRSAERYDLVKIKLSESEAEHRFRLWLGRLWSSETCIVGVGRGSERVNQTRWSIPSIVIGWFFRFCFRLRHSSFHWIVIDGVISGGGRKWELSDSSDSDSVELIWLRLRLRSLIFTRS